MRRFIRHSTDMPVNYRIISGITTKKPMKNISHGGLCFRAGHPIHPHTPIHLEVACLPEFEANGIVVWCHPADRGFEIGVSFDDETTSNSQHAVEQLCLIADYRNYVLDREGRNLSGEQAAIEWHRKYAGVFSYA